MTENNIKQFPLKDKNSLPENLKNTEGYFLNEIYCGPELKTVTDFMSGGQRNRRWGITVSFAMVPGLDQIPSGTGPTLLPKSPSRFFTADTLPELKSRVLHELEKVIEMGRIAVEEPDKFEQYMRSLSSKEQSSEDDMC
jgi:hypothetical protein